MVGARTGARRRRIVRAAPAGHRGHRGVRGQDLPLRAVGPQRGPARKARCGDRHGRLGDPDRPEDRAVRRPPGRLPAHGAVRDPAPGPRLLRVGACRAAQRARSAEGGSRAGLVLPRDADSRPDQERAPHGADQGGRAGHAAGAGPRPRAAGEADPEVHHRLQAHADLEHVLPGDRPRQRRPGHRSDPAGQRSFDHHRRRHRAPHRRPDRVHRLPRHRFADVRAGSRPRGRVAVADVGARGHERAQGHDHPRFPQPVGADGPGYGSGTFVDDLHDRVPGELLHGHAQDQAPPWRRRRRGVGAGPGGVERLDPRPVAGDRVGHRLRFLVPRRARQRPGGVAQLDLEVPREDEEVRRFVV